MRIGSAGSTNINLLQTDSFTFRNKDFVTDNGNAFYGSIETQNSGSQTDYNQLYNPNASGITILLDRMRITTSVDTTLELRSYASLALTTRAQGMNRKLGEADSVGDLNSSNLSSAVGTLIGYVWQLANVGVVYKFDEPIMLSENDGFGFSGAPSQTSNFECWWREV